MCIPTLGLLLGRVFSLVPCVSLSVRGTVAMVAALFVVMTAACGTIASASTCLRVSVGGWEIRLHRGMVYAVTMQVLTALPSMGITYPFTIPSVFCRIWWKTVFLPNRSAVLSPASDFNPGAFSSPRSTGLVSGSTGKFQGLTMGGSKNKSLSNPNGKLCILTVNANSIKGKAAEIVSICDYVKPDIIAMSETKLDKPVNTAEFLPVNFQDNVIRKDRNLHGGGVLLAHREGLVVNPVSCKGIKNDCDLAFSHVSMANGQPPLYVGAHYCSQIDNTANTFLDGLSWVYTCIVSWCRRPSWA